MLFKLIKKDFILVKKYLLFLAVYAVGIPIIYKLKVKEVGGSLVFLATVLILEYVILSTVWIKEEKNKGSVLLCTTPFTRKTLVKERYLFVLTIFILNYILYTATAFVVPIGIEKLSIFNIGLSLLAITIIFGTQLPVLYKFGFQKTRYIGVALVFGMIFSSPKLPRVIRWLDSKKIDINTIIPSIQVVRNIIPYFLAVVVGIISMYISMSIYAKKDL